MPYARELAQARNGLQAGYRSSGARAVAFACCLGRAFAGACGLFVLLVAVVNLLEQ